MPKSTKCGECSKPIKGHKRRASKAGNGSLYRVAKIKKAKTTGFKINEDVTDPWSEFYEGDN